MSDRLSYFLKNAKAVRFLCSPFKNHQRKKAKEKYHNSEDARFIRSFKDTHKGERCFIVGNGPSLTADDLDRLKGEITFGMNRIYNIFDKTDWRPTFYMAVDPDFVLPNYETIRKIPGSIKLISSICPYDPNHEKDNIHYIFEYGRFDINKWNNHSSHVSEDVSEYFSIGYTVTFTAIQMAIYMGFKEIYLLGVDFNYSVRRDAKGRILRDDSVKDYFDGKKYMSTVLNYESALYAYQQAKNYADARGIKIYNATRGGKLEVFERADLDDVLNR